MKWGLSCGSLNSLGPAGKEGRQAPVSSYNAGDKTGELELQDEKESDSQNRMAAETKGW